MLVAGPGSGKTKTLAVKVARMLHEDVSEPRGIACVTFSNECARELERRLADLEVLGRESLFVGTIHTFCLQHIIIPYGYLSDIGISTSITVAKLVDRQNALEEAQSSLGQIENPENNLGNFERIRHAYLGPNHNHSELTAKEVELIQAYEHALRRRGLIDFHDMVVLGLRLIEEQEWVSDLILSRFPILVVDEYQDLGKALHQMVLHLCFKVGVRLFAVGDRDQSIYSFMGAKPDLFQQLSQHDQVKTFQLQLNYRCGNRIVTASKIALAEERDYYTPPNTIDGVIYFTECGSEAEKQAFEICNHVIPKILQTHLTHPENQGYATI